MTSRWSLHPSIDWILGMCTIGAWRMLRSADVIGPLALDGPDARRAVYTQAGTLGTVLIGLFVVPVTLSLALAPRDRLASMLSNRQGELRRAVMQAAAAAVCLVVFSVIAVAIEATPPGNRLIRVLAPGVFVVALLSIVRVLRVLGSLLILSEAAARPNIADDIKSVPTRRLKQSA